MKDYVCTDIGACTLKMGSSARSRSIAEPMPKKLVQAGGITSYSAMAEQLAGGNKKGHLGKSAAVLLPTGKVYVRAMNMPVMGPEEMKLNLPYEFREFVGNAEKDYVYDYAVMSTSKTEEGKVSDLYVLAAAALKSAVLDYSDMFKKAGMKLEIAAPEEMGYCNLVRRFLKGNSDRAQEVFCFVDLGHTATRIHVLNGAAYYTSRVIDVGGQDVDEAIANEMGMDAYVAHDYKELNQQDCQNLPSCRAVYDRIGVDIMRAVNFYSYNNDGQEIRNVYLCGGGMELKPLVDVIREQNPGIEFHDATELYPKELRKAGLGLSPAALGVAFL